MRRNALLGLLLSAALLAPASAHAAVMPFGKLACAPQGGVQWCPGSVATRVPSFDGVPLDLNVALPANASSDLPLVILSHGWGGSKVGFPAMQPWAQRGYAVLAITARGFGDSCGSLSSRQADPVGCAQGWIRLDDTRYEIRDVQYLAGLLADQGIVDPQRIAAQGGSYGGGVSLALAALKDRVMLPDGTLAPWTSPAGKPMRIAAAAPLIPWSDLVYALVPNGRERDDQIVQPGASSTPAGVEKLSFVSGLFADGQASNGYYAPPGADPQADLATWYARISAGEPYDGDPEIAAIQQEIYTHHSAYAIDHSEPPAPTLIANGWSDDLFPPDEAIRFYNRTKAQYPGAPVSMMFMDVGHQRAANKSADEARYQQRVYDWFDRYVKGDTAVDPLHGVEAIPFTCDGSTAPAIDAPSWVAEHPGAVKYSSAAAQTFTSAGGDPTVSAAIDPIAAGNNPCVQTSAADENDVATYRLPAATGSGYTLLGAPTIRANVSVTGAFPEIAERLWDVDPVSGKQTLVARGVVRPDASGVQTFQLHPSGWHFAAGHIAKLELLGRDAPYARPSNGAFAITVSDLRLTLPTHESNPAGAAPRGTRRSSRRARGRVRIHARRR